MALEIESLPIGTYVKSSMSQPANPLPDLVVEGPNEQTARYWDLILMSHK